MARNVFEISFKDGRMYRVFCENRTQQIKLLRSLNEIEDKVKDTKEITCGIHTQKEFTKHLEYIKNQ